jgi:DMSO reductase family type II enzyme heme b subunit
MYNLSLRLMVITGFMLGFAHAAVVAEKVKVDLSKIPEDFSLWTNAKEEVVHLMGQPIALPRSKKTETQNLKVQAVHDGTWIAFRLRWEDTDKSEAGPLGKFSDAVAIEFPVREGSPPPVFMGAKDDPVHLFHWRAQYQKDKEFGKPST